MPQRLSRCCSRPCSNSCAGEQALILCRRHADALEALKHLVPGIDRRYLEAEALWRSGELAQALAGLAAAVADAPDSSKCRSLFAVLNKIEPIGAAAAAALEDGKFLADRWRAPVF